MFFLTSLIACGLLWIAIELWLLARATKPEQRDSQNFFARDSKGISEGSTARTSQKKRS
jgi:hypothetical protein